MAFATRSLTALVVGPVLLLGIWLFNYSQRERPVSFLRYRIVLSFAGALPILVATAAYNARFFGSPLAFGYTAYLGPNHGLGYHFEPFGNVFGPTEGLAYISSDLVALGYFLFRTPISAVLVIGVYLATAARLTNGAKLAAAWALCLLVPYAAYWHHDLLLGPRMISDTAPAWCLLASVAAFGLVRMTPSDKAFFSGRFSPRAFVSSALILSVLLGAVYFAPRDIRANARTFAAAPAPQRANAPTLVFVHGPWDGRIVAKLLAAGMRADSVNVALTLNSTCSMQKFADALSGTPTPGDSGYRLQLSEACEAQAYADRGGPIPLMPLLWQGDLPGIRGAGAMYARDMGPTENARLIARYPQRRVGVLLRRPEDGRSTILPYDTAMNILWSNPAADSTAAEADAPLSP